MTVTELHAQAWRLPSRLTRSTRHLHPEGSFDVADHPVPTGREEIWRFTPLKRLRGLHADADLSGTPSAPRRDAPEGVAVEAIEADEPAARPSGFVPADRVSARVWHEAGRRYAVTVPRRGRARRAGRRRRHAAPAPRAPRRRHVVLTAEPHSKATVVLPLHRLRDAGRHHRDRGRRRRPAHRRQHRRLGRRRRAPRPPARAGRPRRDVQARRRVASAATSCATTPPPSTPAPAASVEMLGLYFADAGQHIEHRLFVDHNAPHTTQPRRLQGRAAGRGRAHGLDRQRADPQGRRGHRDLRGEPQPRAHRRLPGRLGAEPRDRDRRDRGRRPRVGDRPLRRRAAVLPALARHRRRTRRAAWSCTASSTT